MFGSLDHDATSYLKAHDHRGRIACRRAAVLDAQEEGSTCQACRPVAAFTRSASRNFSPPITVLAVLHRFDPRAANCFAPRAEL
jgi:hypothetical protein